MKDTEQIIDSRHVHKSYLRDLFSYRELFLFFAWRDIIVRYKQAFLGVSWTLIKPILQMLVFVFLFRRIANLPSDGINYSLFVLAGMLPWQLFSNSVLDTSVSLINHSTLVSKVYFPKMIIPLAQIIVHLLDACITLCILLLIAVSMGVLHIYSILYLPLFFLLTLCLSMGFALWTSALTVEYRDVRIIVPFLMQFGMFISPIGYGSFIIPEQYQWIYSLNPLVGIIDGFRWALFGTYHDYFLFSLFSAVVTSCLLLISGFFYFRSMERTFADRI